NQIGTLVADPMQVFLLPKTSGRRECYSLFAGTFSGMWRCGRRMWRWGWRRLWSQLRRRGGHRLADEPWRNGSREHRAIAVLLNFQAIKECLHVRIIFRHGNRTFCGVKKLQKGSQLLAQSLGFIFAAGKGLGLEVHVPEIAGRCYHRGRLVE